MRMNGRPAGRELVRFNHVCSLFGTGLQPVRFS